MGLPKLYILRHGETEWNVQGRMQGALDSPLTVKGQAQARAQCDILKRELCTDMQWVSSPMGRAVETAKIAMDGFDATLTIDARLREIEMGDWTGKTRVEILTKRPDLPGLSFYDAAPGGEGITLLTQRMQAFLEQLQAPSVLITHGITSRILRCLATGRDPAQFDEIGGGQGIVYQVETGHQQMLQ
ncbi:histidine phosphatase family protein [Litoreibacter sp.]|nr:histidine phosphatase family protein [Litoreibacter sp.]